VPPKTSRTISNDILQGDSLKPFPWLIHGLSTRREGVSKVYGGKTLNLGFTQQDSRAAVETNRDKFIRSTGAISKGRPWPLVTVRQIHSDLIHLVSEVPKTPLAGDGLITQTPGILLSILTADCLPVILVDAERRAVGVFHAGWRGTLKRIVEKGVGEMHRYFNTSPADIRATIGPGVHGCCYNVGPELRTQFESQFEYGSKLFREVEESDPVREKYPLLFLTARAPGHSELPKKLYLDLVEANRQQLRAIGVASKHISASPLCTACRNDLLFSYRAEKGVTGRMMAVAGIRG
jgi:polyphenol oxidase